MSWSVSTSGNKHDVKRTVDNTLAGYQCPLPERSIKASVRNAIAAALSQWPEKTGVMVTASGTQVTRSDGSCTHDVQLSIRAHNADPEARIGGSL